MIILIMKQLPFCKTPQNNSFVPSKTFFQLGRYGSINSISWAEDQDTKAPPNVQAYQNNL